MDHSQEKVHNTIPADPELADMPLHDITLKHGLEGLKRRFELEADQLTEEGRNLVDKALELAMRVHAADIRKSDEPTSNHLLRVAIRIMHHYGITDPAIIAAALLHDSVEDHPDLIVGDEGATKDNALAQLSLNMNSEVAELVSEVTNPEWDPNRDKIEQYHEHVRELLSGNNFKAKIIKVSDFTDNALGLKYLITDDMDLPESVTYRAKRYLPIVDDFEQAFVDENLPISEQAREHILKQIASTRVLLTELSLHSGPA